jgi:hypothetical protein
MTDFKSTFNRLNCDHHKDKVAAVIVEYLKKNQNDIESHETWISGWRCKCGTDVLPETYKAVNTVNVPDET